jgi:hypothetical protein
MANSNFEIEGMRTKSFGYEKIPFFMCFFVQCSRHWPLFFNGFPFYVFGFFPLRGCMEKAPKVDKIGCNRAIAEKTLYTSRFYRPF